MFDYPVNPFLSKQLRTQKWIFFWLSKSDKHSGLKDLTYMKIPCIIWNEKNYTCRSLKKGKQLKSRSCHVSTSPLLRLELQGELMPHLRRVRLLLHLPPMSRGLTRCTHSTDTAAGQAKTVSTDVENRAKAALNPYKAWWCYPAAALIQSSPITRVNTQHPWK